MIDNEKLKTLEDYAGLDGTEVGEYISDLLCVRRHRESHGMSPEFDLALDTELLMWLETFENETTIEEIVEPQPDRIIRELNWN